MITASRLALAAILFSSWGCARGDYVIASARDDKGTTILLNTRTGETKALVWNYNDQGGQPFWQHIADDRPATTPNRSSSASTAGQP